MRPFEADMRLADSSFHLQEAWPGEYVVVQDTMPMCQVFLIGELHITLRITEVVNDAPRDPKAKTPYPPTGRALIDIDSGRVYRIYANDVRVVKYATAEEVSKHAFGGHKKTWGAEGAGMTKGSLTGRHDDGEY